MAIPSLKWYRRLMEAGFTDEQARAMTGILIEREEDLVTNEDLARELQDVRREIGDLRKDMEHGFALMERRFAEMEREFAQLREETQRKLEHAMASSAGTRTGLPRRRR